MNNHGELSFEQIVSYLKATGQEENELFQRAAAIKQTHVGNNVDLRGVIEFSNI